MEFSALGPDNRRFARFGSASIRHRKAIARRSGCILKTGRYSSRSLRLSPHGFRRSICRRLNSEGTAIRRVHRENVPSRASAQTSRRILKTRIAPCQFGSEPVCAECGGMAPAGMYAVSLKRLASLIPLSAVPEASLQLGRRQTPA